ncbi:MAG: hypothetical protein EZS28_045601, partial [Streblomastix strix]
AIVILEVIIEEEQKEEGKGFPIGAIVGIAVGALATIAVIIIIVIVAFKTKKPAISYGSELRARDLPMEIKYQQNSHSLDEFNKEMESNNW